MKREAQKIIDFINYAEKSKVELRYPSKSNNARESVAEHCWRLSLMLVLVVPKLKIKIDFLKILKMAIVHDLVEIESKDVPIFEYINDKARAKDKNKKEKKAIQKIRKMLGRDGEEIYSLWLEFEKLKTNEAIVLKALDRLESDFQFMSESVTKFSSRDHKALRIILAETAKLSRIDPFLEELDKTTLTQRRDRIKQ